MKLLKKILSSLWPKKTSPLRFRPHPVAQSYTLLVDILFAFVLGQGFVEHKGLITDPSFSLESLSFLLVYITIILSWDGYHKSIAKYPYNQTFWSRLRLYLDIIIVATYAFLIFEIIHPPKVLFGLGIIFTLYAVDGSVRKQEWKDKRVGSPLISISFAVIFFLLSHFATRTLWLSILLALFFVVAFRFVRGIFGYPKLVIIGVDVDGVLCDQVPPVLNRVQKEGKGLTLTKRDITTWRHEFDGTNFEIEIERALQDTNFIAEMPVMQGSTKAMNELFSNTDPYFHIVIATTRPKETEDATVNWVEKHFPFHEFVNARDVGKHNLGFDILIDDNLDNVKRFARSQGLAILLSQPWNQDDSDPLIQELISEKRIVRCGEWENIIHAAKRFLS